MASQSEDLLLCQMLEKVYDDRAKPYFQKSKEEGTFFNRCLTPIVEQLQNNPICQKLRLTFEEPILVYTPYDSPGFEPSEYRHMLPVILDLDSWRCEKTNTYPIDVGFKPHEIFWNVAQTNDATLQFGYIKQSVTASEMVQSVNEVPKQLRPEDLNTKNKSLVPGCLRCNLLIDMSLDEPDFTSLLSSTFGTESSFHLTLMKLGPILKLKPDDGSNDIVLMPISIPGIGKLWRRSLSAEENKLMEELDGEKFGRRYKVWKILLYAARHQSTSPLKKLDPEVYKNAVLHIPADDGNEMKNLGMIFRLVLHFVERSLRLGTMERYFEPQHNLLTLMSKESLENVEKALTMARMTKNYQKLLIDG